MLLDLTHPLETPLAALVAHDRMKRLPATVHELLKAQQPVIDETKATNEKPRERYAEIVHLLLLTLDDKPKNLNQLVKATKKTRSIVNHGLRVLILQGRVKNIAPKPAPGQYVRTSPTKRF